MRILYAFIAIIMACQINACTHPDNQETARHSASHVDKAIDIIYEKRNELARQCGDAYVIYHTHDAPDFEKYLQSLQQPEETTNKTRECVNTLSKFNEAHSYLVRAYGVLKALDKPAIPEVQQENNQN